MADLMAAMKVARMAVMSEHQLVGVKVDPLADGSVVHWAETKVAATVALTADLKVGLLAAMTAAS